jgi:hypothetical protein
VLASLPTNPQALLTVIANQAADQNAQNIAAGNPIAGVAPKTEAQREFDYLTLILWNAAIGAGGPPAAEAAAYQAMAALPGITVQQGIKDTAGGQAIGVSDDGGYDQLGPLAQHLACPSHRNLDHGSADSHQRLLLRLLRGLLLRQHARPPQDRAAEWLRTDPDQGNRVVSPDSQDHFRGRGPDAVPGCGSSRRRRGAERQHHRQDGGYGG